MRGTPRTAKESYVEEGEDQFLVVRAEFACLLERELQAAYAELNKHAGTIGAVFDRDVWLRAKKDAQ